MNLISSFRRSTPKITHTEYCILCLHAFYIRIILDRYLDLILITTIHNIQVSSCMDETLFPDLTQPLAHVWDYHSITVGGPN